MYVHVRTCTCVVCMYILLYVCMCVGVHEYNLLVLIMQILHMADIQACCSLKFTFLSGKGQ